MVNKNQKSKILGRLFLKNQTRAQLKIQQMAFMLMAVTLFFVLAGMFMLAIMFSGVKKQATALEEENALSLVTKIANSPEFSCGCSFGNKEKLNCIDADKVMMLKERIGKYDDFWGDLSIEIRKVYPENSEKICDFDNYPDCNIIRLSNEISGYDLSNFISLCRKESVNGEVEDRCELAKIMISYNEK